MSDFQLLRQMCQKEPNMDFTVNMMTGAYEKIVKGASSKDPSDMALGNVAFRSRVLRAIVDELDLPNDSLFLKELCSQLKIGPVQSLDAAEEVLDTTTLNQVFAKISQYTSRQTQALELLANSQRCADGKEMFQTMIRLADSSTLNMIYRDLVAESQRATLAPYERFVESCLPITHPQSAVSNMMAMIATIKAHPRYDRAMLATFLETHREALIHRAAALMYRDKLESGKNFTKLVACTVEALDGLLNEQRILTQKLGGTSTDSWRKGLLEKMYLRMRIMPCHELPGPLAEIMCQQIATGDMRVLDYYQDGLAEGTMVSVPYPFGQGEQVVVGTELQRQELELHMNQVIKEDNVDWTDLTVLDHEAEVQMLDLERNFEIYLDGKPIPKGTTRDEIIKTLQEYFDVKNHPENASLVIACAYWAQQRALIVEQTHPLVLKKAVTLFDFKEGKTPVEETRTVFHVTRIKDGFQLETEYRIHAPESMVYYGKKDVEILPIRNQTPEHYASKTQTVCIVQDGKEVNVRVPTPTTFRYHLNTPR